MLGSCSAPDNWHPAKLVRIRWTRDPETLSPISLSNQNAFDAANLLYCGLLQLDFSRNTWAPALADSLPAVRLIGDSLTYISYRLRAQATWDDGRPVVATDVDFTLKLMQCPGLPNEGTRTQFAFIRGLRPHASDERRFTLVCRGQAAEYQLASGDFPILPEAALDPQHTLRRFTIADMQDGRGAVLAAPALRALVQRYEQLDLAHHPDRLPGCGAYRLTAWETGQALTFERKAVWWADQLRPTPTVLLARPQQIQFLIIPEDATATLALRRHELDVYPQVPAREFQRLQAVAGQELRLYNSASYDIVYVGFNTQRPTLHDKLTRQALACLFDPARLMQATQLGLGSRTVGLIYPTDRQYYNDSLPLPTYNPSRTLELLQLAGWHRQADGWLRQSTSSAAQRLGVTLHYRTGDATFETIALQFKAAAGALGIPIELRPIEGSVMTKELRQGNFDLFVRLLKGGPAAFNFIPILDSQSIGENNFTRFSNPASDQLIRAIAATGEPTRKRHLLRRFQVLMRDEMPLLPLFVLPYRLAADRRLQHLYPSGLRPGYAAAALSWAPADSSKSRTR